MIHTKVLQYKSASYLNVIMSLRQCCVVVDIIPLAPITLRARSRPITLVLC